MDCRVLIRHHVDPDTGQGIASVQQLCHVLITQSLLLLWRSCFADAQDRKYWNTRELQNHLWQAEHGGTCLTPWWGCKMKSVHVHFKFSAVLLCWTWTNHTSNNMFFWRSSVFNLIYYIFTACVLECYYKLLKCIIIVIIITFEETYVSLCSAVTDSL